MSLPPDPSQPMSIRQRGRVALLASAVLASSCQAPFTTRSPAPVVDPRLPDAAAVPAPAPAPAPTPVPETRAAALKLPGTGTLTGPGRPVHAATPAPGAAAADKEFTVNLQDADLHEVAKVILGDLLQANYSVEPGVAGSIAVQSSRPLKREDLLPLLETALAVNNAALIAEPNGSYRIVKRENAPAAAIPLAPSTRGLPPGYHTRIVPLAHIAVGEIQKILEPVLKKQAVLYADTRRNVLVLAGARSELERALDLVAMFDVDWLAGMSIGMFPLSYADATIVTEELKSLLGAGDEAAIAGLVRLLPIERLNSILVITPRAQYLDRMQTWIERLDQADTGGGRRVYVYRVKNGKASDLAEVLSDIFAQREEARGTAPAARVAPREQAVALQSRPRSGESRSARTTRATGTSDAQAAQSAPAATTPAAGTSGENRRFGNSGRIIADDVNNALVIMATLPEFRMLESALKELDVVPLQVLIEASIIEVTLNDELRYGVEWFFKNGFEQAKGKGLLDLGEAGIGAIVPGFSYAVVDSADSVRAVLNALSEHSRFNVLSSPSLMVLGNQTATINVGDQVPVPSRQSVSNIDPQAPTVNEIQYRDTGVILEVTPRVNPGGLITMEIAQEVSDVARTTTSGIDAPTFQQRKISSTVAIQSGNTVVLGGLIRDRVTATENGVPVLHQIPVLGKLFGSTANTNLRTELMVLITPRAVNNNQEAVDVTDEFRTRLRGVDRQFFQAR
ncbi:MAG: type II secretion system secretin GspD [Gammaproteobacteria bacterium]